MLLTSEQSTPQEVLQLPPPEIWQGRSPPNPAEAREGAAEMQPVSPGETDWVQEDKSSPNETTLEN